MESLKVMKKINGGNFHFWKFNVHMMFSNHGLWKFVNGSAIIHDDENEMVVYKKKR
jgi:hypothetical protein